MGLYQIPKYLADAFVAVEDERFYEHNGIDIRGIIRAGFAALQNGELSQGASTITQQIIKNNVFDFIFSRTISRLVSLCSGWDMGLYFEGFDVVATITAHSDSVN